MNPQTEIDFSLPVSHPVGIRRDAQAIDDAFAKPVLETPIRLIRGKVRGTDPIESQRAAVRQLDHLSEIQRQILHILATEGPHNARQLEQRIEFRGLAPSTCRKRLSELKQAGAIVQVGRSDGCAVYDIAPK